MGTIARALTCSRPPRRRSSPLVVAETAYLIDRQLGASAEAGFFRSIAAGDVLVEALTATDYARIADLVERYGDLPLGGSDASLVALAERLGAVKVATLDQRHFRVVRPRHVEALTLVP
ncbi:MAG: type II toxin-antitoxin system VapC family toxin [Acidimicrobiales bacterium]